MQATTGCLRTLMSCTSPGLAQGRAFVQGAWHLQRSIFWHLQRSSLSILHMNQSSGSWLLSEPLEAWVTVPIHSESVSQLLGMKLMVTCVCGQEPVASPLSCISAFQKLPPACSIQLTVQRASPCCHFPGLLDPRIEGKGP